MGEKHGIWQMGSTGGGQSLFSVPGRTGLGAATSQHCPLVTLSADATLQKSSSKIGGHHQLQISEKSQGPTPFDPGLVWEPQDVRVFYSLLFHQPARIIL